MIDEIRHGRKQIVTTEDESNIEKDIESVFKEIKGDYINKLREIRKKGIISKEEFERRLKVKLRK